ncbi:MAG: hypothetical protein WD826_02640 [Actinomycetota bacterium]
MAPTHVELYEALRQHVGDDAAAMMAEVIPPAANLATKDDLRGEIAAVRSEIADLRSELKLEIAGLRGEMREGFAMLRGEIAKSQASNLRWMLTMFVPVWAGTWATVAAVILKL